MYIYHGTDPLTLRRIKKEGLCGRPKGTKVYWSESKRIYFSNTLSYGMNYAAPITKDMSLQDDVTLDKRFKGKWQSIPGVVIRTKDDDIGFKNCKKSTGRYRDPYETVFECKKNCIKPKEIQICFITPDERIKIRNLMNDYDLAEDVAQKICKDRWKPFTID